MPHIKRSDRFALVVLSIAPCSQPRLFGCDFFRCSHTYFLPQHTLFQQIRKPEALWWCIPIQAFYVDDFEKQVMVIMLLRGTLSTRTLYGGFAVVMGVER